jgi:intracellular multiplication protein IcmB
LVDAVTAARRPQIRALLEETQIGASAETVIHAFERMIASAVREFPILASVTRFDIGGARVAAVDLQDVAPHGDALADRQTAIMYMLARHALVRSWWLGTDMLRSVPEKYHSYHEARVRDIRETPKRICYDEFHRTSRSTAVRAQVIRDVREGRKWGVQIVLASQLLDDFSKDMVDLATGIWICGSAVSDRAITETAELFGLTDTARWVMRYRLTGPRPSGAPVLLLLSTHEGRYEQHLVNTLGPIELWALSTSVEDVTLRNNLYTALGAPEGRQILAKFFPGGSARHEVRRRVIARTERGELESGATAAVISELAQELVAFAHSDPAKTVIKGS